MKITENTIKKTARTFIQTALGYIAVNVNLINFADEKQAIKSTLIGLAVSSVSAGICAVMNLEKEVG